MPGDPSTAGATFAVIVPAYNERRLGLLLSRFDFARTPDVVVVDDGSDDGSTAAAAGFAVTVLRHERSLGVGAAIRTGLAHLKARGVDVAVVIAGNNKDDPADIPRLVQRIADGADYVQGSRYAAGGDARPTPLGRRVITRAVAWLWSVRFRRPLTDVTNGFRAYRLALLDDPAIDVTQAWLSRYELEYYLHYKVLALGYRYAELPVTKRYPADGLPTSKIRLWRDGWSLLRPFVLLTLGVKR